MFLIYLALVFASIALFLRGRGNLYKDPSAATRADLARAMGQVGDRNTLEDGLANRMIEHRHAIERVFAEHDEMVKEPENDDAG